MKIDDIKLCFISVYGKESPFTVLAKVLFFPFVLLMIISIGAIIFAQFLFLKISRLHKLYSKLEAMFKFFFVKRGNQG